MYQDNGGIKTVSDPFSNDKEEKVVWPHSTKFDPNTITLDG